MADLVAPLRPAALKTRLGAGERITLLDVREPAERAIAVIAVPTTAVDLAIPMGEIPGMVEAIREAAKAGPVVVYCHHGQRSLVVATWLARRGIVGIANLEGGIDAWSTRVDHAVARY